MTPSDHLADEPVVIREGTAADLPFLREMLFEAAFWRPGTERPPLDQALADPELAKILAGWGRAGDAAVIACQRQEERVGAAWYRFWNDQDHSYGYVAADVPELGVAVAGPQRGRGVGSRLIAALLSVAAEQGFAQMSLSVEQDNPAVRVYSRLGFNSVATLGNALTMVAPTRRA